LDHIPLLKIRFFQTFEDVPLLGVCLIFHNKRAMMPIASAVCFGVVI